MQWPISHLLVGDQWKMDINNIKEAAIYIFFVYILSMCTPQQSCLMKIAEKTVAQASDITNA